MNDFLKELIAVALGGALGSSARFLLARAVQGIHRLQHYPLGIFLVNVIGSLLIGVLAGLLIGRDWLNPAWRSFLVIGLLGGFTTFSSFSLDTVMLWSQGLRALASVNVIATLLCCLLATALGLSLSRF